MERIPSLPLSSIDDRIKKACQVPRIQAVLKYLPFGGGGGAKPPLHPPYVCWYDSCESCGPWTVDPNFSCSPDIVDFKECGASLVFICTANVNDKHCSIPISNCATYVGFWARIVFPASPNRAQRYQVRTSVSGSWFGACFINFGESPVPKYAAILEAWDGDLHTGTWTSFVPNTWIWVELRKVSTTSYAWYLDGVQKVGLSTHYDLGDFVNFWLQQNYGSEPWGTGKIDYLRVADREEYPPA